jgi:hypothetical protein
MLHLHSNPRKFSFAVYYSLSLLFKVPQSVHDPNPLTLLLTEPILLALPHCDLISVPLPQCIVQRLTLTLHVRR